MDFSYPPRVDDDEQAQAVTRESTSISGVRQTSTDRTEYLRKVTYSFLTATQLGALRTFFDSWGKFGKEFTYYPHVQDTGISYLYSLQDKTFNSKRLFPKAGDFLYEITFTFRRFTV